MRYLVSCVALIACSVLAMSALAQDAKKDEKKDDNRAQLKERLLKEFDANKDGKLDAQEKEKAKEKMTGPYILMTTRREKWKSGFIARAFSTHPMNDDRIRRAEAELEMLPPRDDYILTTSEFDQMKSRLIQLTRGRVIDDGKASHPALRKHKVEDEHPPFQRR